MKSEELEAIKRRAEAATPGPWGIFEIDDEWIVGLKRGGFKNRMWIKDSSAIERREDAEFIAHARTDVKELVGEVEKREKLRVLSSRLLEVVDEMHPTIGDVYAEKDDPFYDVIADIRRVLGEG